MLRLGLTGGIGSGKSTVAGMLRELGAVVTDADQIAREVVQPGQPALDAIARQFGPAVIREDGALDRAALAEVVFRSPERLASLEAITHPAVAAATALRRGQAPADCVNVYDVPLLVERGLGVHEHLALVVGASEQVRVHRLVASRGLSESDARARIAAQASDAQRRAAADLWVDNDGSRQATREQVERLWDQRLVPFEHNLQHGTRVRRPEPLALSEPDPTWAAQGARLVARIAAALGQLAARVDHVGSTSVPGVLAKDVIDVQVGVQRLDDADRPVFLAQMREAGYALMSQDVGEQPHPAGAPEAGWAKRFYGGCDPGRLTHVYIREVGSPSHDFTLAFRDWLLASSDGRQTYAAEKSRLAGVHSTARAYAEAKATWFDTVYGQVLAWQRDSGWTA